MLFDLNIKTKKEDFFNYEEEYTKVKANLFSEKIITVAGLRRVGKSSLMSVIYHELDSPKIWIDGRRIRDAGEFFIYLDDLAAQLSLTNRAFRELSSVEIGPITFSINHKKKVEDIERLIKKRAFIFIDEAQLIRDIDNIISYIYDHTTKITLVVAGSEVGTLDRVLGKKGGPMAGRLHFRVDMYPLSKESAKEFLKRGFAELGKDIPAYEIDDAILNLGTLPGWLTYYGTLRLSEKHSAALHRVIEDGKVIVSEELNNFLAGRRNRKRYLKILKILSSGEKTWEEIYDLLRLDEKKIQKSRITEFLSTLIDYGFVNKERDRYSLADPMIRHFVSSGKIKN